MCGVEFSSILASRTACFQAFLTDFTGQSLPLPDELCDDALVAPAPDVGRRYGAPADTAASACVKQH